MAQQSYRLHDRFTRGSWWRLEISWRTSPSDPRHFIEEWTGTIPLESSTDTRWSVPELSWEARDSAEVIQAGIGKITVRSNALTDAWLAVTNASAEARIWWSGNGTTWEILFWGIVNFDDLSAPTERIIAGAYSKVYDVTLYDSIKRLDEVAFRDYTRMDDTSYKLDVASTNAVYLGNNLLSNITLPQKGADGRSFSASPRPSSDMVSLLFPLDQCARVCYDEQYDNPTAFSRAIFGHVYPGAVDSVFRFIGRTDQTSGGARVENSFMYTYWWFDAFSAEWASEFRSWGEFVHMLCDGLGFTVSTGFRVLNNAPYYPVIRYLRYSRIAGDNGSVLTPVGGLLSRRQTKVRRSQKFVTVSTRTPSGAWAAPKDHTPDTLSLGQDVKLRTFWRVMHPVSPADYFPLGISGNAGLEYNQARNTFWHTLAIVHPSISNRLQIVTQVKYTKGAATLTAPSDTGYSTWDKNTSINFGGGWARVMAEYYSQAEWKRGNRIIEEEYNDVRANNGSTSSPAHWLPYAHFSDGEFTGETFKVVGVKIQPEAGENGRVTVTKETK